MKGITILFKILRKFYRIFKNRKFLNPTCELDRQLANDKIFNLLISDNPCMISRFGTTELITINNYLCINENKSVFKKIIKFISDNTHLPWWQIENFKYLDEFSGVYPPTINTIVNFSKRYLNDIPLIDLLGSFQYYERFMPLKGDIQNVHLETLYPFFVERPWTLALKGKKVLVVHPFELTIQTQFKIRKDLFSNEDILPNFELITLKSIQSAGGIRPPFKDWFESLKYLEDRISEIDFDICILGCGAYGLPLAAHVKRLGKKSFHIGGGLQLLFGIKGERWSEESKYGKWYEIPELFKSNYCDLFNDFWIRPLAVDTPKSANKIDGGSYW